MIDREVELAAWLVEARMLTDELADVLCRMVIGWEDTLGVDLAQHPDVLAVMAKFRARSWAD